MIYISEKELFDGTVLEEIEDCVLIKDKQKFREKKVDDLVDTLVLSNSDSLKKLCYWIAHEASHQFGILPSSIQDLYTARASKGLTHFTVPAINLRTLTYDLGRAAFRAAKKINAGAFVLEIAKSEMGYTAQNPFDYTSCLILAGIKEGYKGPLFIQGDHFQLKEKNFKIDREKEIEQLKDLISDSVEAGFYNIDIDSSTLVDLSQPDFDTQQRSNYEVCALFTEFIRGLQPKDIEISIGGEIGEVGGKNSTPEELQAFMKGYNSKIGDLKGISKISIQTGSHHGGVVLPDGTIAKVKIDFETLRALSEMARKEFFMAGAVQHGASTLPRDVFDRFPEAGCAEIHLATQFQNIVFDFFPPSLKNSIHDWLHQNATDKKKSGMTDDQFIYKTRKKALGPFRKEIHNLPRDLKDRIALEMEKEFSFLFDKLNIKDTKELIDSHDKGVKVEKTKHVFLKERTELTDMEGAD